MGNADGIVDPSSNEFYRLLLEKPYTTAQLLSRVRAILDQERS